MSVTVLPRVPFDADALSRHVERLASDEFGGRAPASEGEIRTIEYLRREFGRYGLQPAGEDGGWTQRVPLRSLDLIEVPALSVATARGTLNFRNGEEVVLTSLSNDACIELHDVPLVFVGYGVTAPELQWDDFKGVDLRGKVAVFLVNDPDCEAPVPGRFGGKAMTYYGRWIYKFEEAERRGAAGAVIIHEDGPAGYGWTTVRNTWSITQFDINRSPRDTLLPLRAWIQRDAVAELLQRAGEDLDVLKGRARSPEFTPVPLAGLRLSTRLRLRAEPVTTHNIIARLPGRARPEESIVYCAHWDHLGIGKPDDSGDAIYHGALDNATGVAGVLELARVYASERSVQRTVYCIAFAAEERGLLGSQFYVQHPSAPLESTAALFNMELLGIGGPARDVMTWGLPKSTLHDALCEAARAQGRSVTADRYPESGYFYRSDNFPFARLGVPGVTISSGQDLYDGGLEAGKQAYESYIARQYHRPADRWSASLDLRGVALDLDVIYRAGRSIADSDSWPEWYEGSEFKRLR